MKFNYLSMIAEMTTIEAMPNEWIDEKEEQDHQRDNAHLSLKYLSEECKSITELNAVLAVAKAFHYNTTCIENKISYLEKKLHQSAIFEQEFELAQQEVQKEKDLEIAKLFTTYEIMDAQGLC